MSSVASKHALIIALGGVSIAALFVWYYQAKRQEERNRKKSIALKQETEKSSENAHQPTTATTTAAASTTTKKSKRNKKSSESQNEQVEKKEDVSRPAPSASDVTVPSTQEVVVESDEKIAQAEPASVPTVTVESSEQVEAGIAEEKQREVLLEHKNEVLVNETESDHSEAEQVTIGGEEVKPEVVEEEIVQKIEVQKTQAAAPAPIEMPKKRHSENEQIPEEPTPTKVLDQPLSLDIGAQMSPASFSWSEEMERSYMEGLNESSDMEASPISPAHKSVKNSRPNKSRKGRGSGSQSVNKRGPQRRLHSVEERAGDNQQEDEVHVQRNGVVFDTAEHGDHNDDVGYDKSDSPGLASQNSEASSQDSGRATGGLASSLSPMDENGQVINDDINDLLPMYEFEIPNSLVGLIIGVKGKTIKELSVRTNVRMLIRQHHTPEKVKTHQICQVRGKRDEINHCLQMLRRRFPSPRFPELNLQPVLPPPLPNNSFDMLSTQPTWLTLPEEIKCEIAVSAIIDPSHFFIHQPSHPSFNSLCHLDMYMLRLYGEHSNLPELPTPCQNGLLCAAPVVNAWFRAVTVQYYEDTDEVFVKFVDYGGYSKMARQDLRQIRTDLMSLPFQSTEVMLAHVRPVDGTTNWSEPAMQEFNNLCTGRVISAKLVGYAIDTKIPMIELYVPVKDANGESHEMRFDQYLMEKGLARTADPSKMARPSTASIAATQIGAKRPSLTSQTSQTTVVC